MEGHISVADLDQYLYTTDCPDPDIMIRTSGETRLSNFLLWQTTFSHLQNVVPLWPEFSLRHLVWAIVEYQNVYPYLEELKSKSKDRHRKSAFGYWPIVFCFCTILAILINARSLSYYVKYI